MLEFDISELFSPAVMSGDELHPVTPMFAVLLKLRRLLDVRRTPQSHSEPPFVAEGEWVLGS